MRHAARGPARSSGVGRKLDGPLAVTGEGVGKLPASAARYAAVRRSAAAVPALRHRGGSIRSTQEAAAGRSLRDARAVTRPAAMRPGKHPRHPRRAPQINRLARAAENPSNHCPRPCRARFQIATRAPGQPAGLAKSTPELIVAARVWVIERRRADNSLLRVIQLATNPKATTSNLRRFLHRCEEGCGFRG